ncbi:MAG: hypothetical protein D3908_13545, partial [Candidatus Electrothrix sp. AUS4]|nr:hypothetical protein [Candidatus Electrothrix sp. AUS4]
YVYAGSDLLSMFSYVQEGSGGALVFTEPVLYYYITDHLGTPQMVVDATGQVLWQGDYLPFGEVQVAVNQVGNSIRFPGQYFDGETGLHYNWNRYYDPATGRYISADPIGFDGGMNLFAYVGADPINRIDPDGLKDRPWPVNGRVIVDKDCTKKIRSVDMDKRSIHYGTTPRTADVDFVEVDGVWYKIGMWNFNVDGCDCKPDGGFRQATPEELKDIKSILGSK